MPDHRLDPILRPRSIAVVGASRTPRTVGHEIVASLARCGFTGPIYPVNPKARSICSIPAFPTVAEIPEQVDQAIIVTPAAVVLDVVRDCIERGVKGLVVISAGFREIGADGEARERELTRLVREAGVRMVGPNCMGVLNADPAIAMNGTFFPNLPPVGRAAFVSQSGALGLSVLDYASEYGIGIAQFVSVGNKPDVSGNDLLETWEQDPEIDLILMYIESFGNPRKFLEIATRITRTKPIVAVKSGRSRAGAQAASSHTGALAASDLAVDAMLTQAGVLRASSVEELFDFAIAFSGQPLPKSRRTAVLTNAGGPGILAADALETHGIEVSTLSDQTVTRLAPLFPSYAAIRNPLDMIASATPQGYRAALDALLVDPNVDAVLAIFVPPLGVSQADVSEAIADAALASPGKTIMAVLMGHAGLPQGKAGLRHAGIPAYVFPESAARALGALVRHRERTERPAPVFPSLDVDRDRVAGLLAACPADTRKLAEPEALEVLDAYGIPTARARLARTAEEAAALAADGPVALKVVAPAIVHKSDVGGVELDVSGPEEAAAAFERIRQRVTGAAPSATIDGVLVQPMVAPGRDLIVGATRDPSFGPLIMVGLGGIFVEALGDVAFRMVPLPRDEAGRMVRSLRSAKLFGALRGLPEADLAAVEEVILRIAALMSDHPSIAELDVNPLVVYGDGVRAADARVVLGDSPAA
ncbi:MAG: acetate--CoA ligase family protein [Gemmatimonadales bacterium]